MFTMLVEGAVHVPMLNAVLIHGRPRGKMERKWLEVEGVPGLQLTLLRAIMVDGIAAGVITYAVVPGDYRPADLVGRVVKG